MGDGKTSVIASNVTAKVIRSLRKPDGVQRRTGWEQPRKVTIGLVGFQEYDI